MRTLYTLFALISLVLVALVATAAPASPSLVPDCGTACQSGLITLTASGVNTHKSYGVTGSNGTVDFVDVMTAQPDGTFTLTRSFDSGDWVLTLSVLGHTGDPSNPQRDILTIDVAVAP